MATMDIKSNEQAIDADDERPVVFVRVDETKDMNNTRRYEFLIGTSSSGSNKGCGSWVSWTWKNTQTGNRVRTWNYRFSDPDHNEVPISIPKQGGRETVIASHIKRFMDTAYPAKRWAAVEEDRRRQDAKPQNGKEGKRHHCAFLNNYLENVFSFVQDGRILLCSYNENRLHENKRPKSAWTSSHPVITNSFPAGGPSSLQQPEVKGLWYKLSSGEQWARR